MAISFYVLSETSNEPPHVYWVFICDDRKRSDEEVSLGSLSCEPCGFRRRQVSRCVLHELPQTSNTACLHLKRFPFQPLQGFDTFVYIYITFTFMAFVRVSYPERLTV